MSLDRFRSLPDQTSSKINVDLVLFLLQSMIISPTFRKRQSLSIVERLLLLQSIRIMAMTASLVWTMEICS
jgi:hypothetical protein